MKCTCSYCLLGSRDSTPYGNLFNSTAFNAMHSKNTVDAELYVHGWKRGLQVSVGIHSGLNTEYIYMQTHT